MKQKAASGKVERAGSTSDPEARFTIIATLLPSVLAGALRRAGRSNSTSSFLGSSGHANRVTIATVDPMAAPHTTSNG